MNGAVAFVDTSDCTVMNIAEHYMASDVEWDPTGRYVVTSVSWWSHKVRGPEHPAGSASGPLPSPQDCSSVGGGASCCSGVPSLACALSPLCSHGAPTQQRERALAIVSHSLSSLPAGLRCYEDRCHFS